MTLKMKRLTAAILAAIASTAYAEQQKRHFDIPAQSLGSALQTLAAQSGAPMLYAEQTAAGKQSPRLSGDYTTAEAADKLLAGSGLVHSVAADGTVTVKPAPQKQEATSLKPVTVLGETNEDPYSRDYNVRNSSTATKTDTLLMQTPVSIQIVPKAVMDDQQVVRLEDATKNVSGIHAMKQLGGLYENFVIRGFTTPDFNIYRDGLRLGLQSFETANLERVEVLKGPASTLYGRGAPGGLVNLATKKPLTDRHYAVSQQFGSYDFYRTTLDATGSLTSDGSLAYRTNFVYSDGNSFRDFVGNERIFVAPQLTWRLSGQTEFNFGLEYKKDETTGDRGIPAIGNRPADVPISRFIGEPDFSKQDAESYLAHFSWSHQFNDQWKLQQRFAANMVDTFNRNIIPISLRADNQTINRGLFNGLTERNTYTTNIDLNGKFDLYGMDHNVLVGFDHLRFDSNRVATFLASAPYITTLNLFNPVYGNVRLPANLPINNYVAGQDEWYGVYFQDQVDLTKNLHFMFGGRHDWATGANGSSTVSTPSMNSVSTEKFSPRMGLVYQPMEWVSFFANWSDSLGRNNGISTNNKPFAPELAEEFEGGVKTEFFDGRLNTSFVVYELTKTNVLTADTSTADPSDQVAIGQARSQGIEFDFTGKLTEQLSLIGNYAYTDTEVLKDDSGLKGKKLQNVPEHSSSLWLNYEFTGGFRLGTGTYLAGQRQANAANDFQLPGYARWDAMAGYQWKVGASKVTAQVNVNNILDKQYYKFADIYGNARFDAMPGEPLTVFGSLKFEY